MKALITLALLLAVASCQIYNMNVANECSQLGCARSFWNFNNTNYNYTCPRAGASYGRFRGVNGSYVFDFIAQNVTNNMDVQATIPLYYNQNAYQSGLQYYYPLQQNHTFAILNCTFPISQNYTNLCSQHALVGGKIYNNTFQNACAFGLDAPRYAFLQQELENSMF
ncbi:hypothetical protein ABPG72_021886 [Tetrahymena utriculariae]